MNFNINSNYIKMSERKSFAQVLKENLTEKSFKNKPKLKPKPPVPKLQHKKITTCEEISDPFKKEIHEFFIGIKDLSKIHSSRSFYAKLFKKPIKIAFYWCEEDWQGSIFAVYEYNEKFISVEGGYGSCEICDAFISYDEEPREHSEDMLNNVFSHLTINENIDDINIHGNYPEYTHPELISKFQNWKGSYAPPRQIEAKEEKVENIEAKVENFEAEVKEELIKNVEAKEIKEENVVKEVLKKTWAEIVSKKK